MLIKQVGKHGKRAKVGLEQRRASGHARACGGPCRVKAGIALFAAVFLGSCDDSIKISDFLQEAGASFQVVHSFGELISTGPSQVAHYMEVQLTPADTPVFAPSGGEIVFDDDLDGLVDCVVIKPTLRADDEATPLDDLGPGLAKAEDIRIAVCNLDNSGAASPLREAIKTLYTEAEDADPEDKTTRFFDTALEPKDRRGNVWAAPDAVFPDPVLPGAEEKRWSRLGQAASGKLQVAVFEMKDDHPVYVNPVPYLAKIPLTPVASALRPPTIAEIKIETASDANFTADLKSYNVNVSTGALTPDEALEGFVRVFFRLTRNADDGGSTPVVAPYEISYALEQTGGAGTIRSHGSFFPNSLATSAAVTLIARSQSVAEILYPVDGPAGTVSDPATEELWIRLPIDPAAFDPAGSVPKYDIGGSVPAPHIDVNARTGGGQPRFPADDYELSIVLASGFGSATSDTKTVQFALAGPVLPIVELVSDAANDHTVDDTDPVIDHAQVGHWGADSGAGVDGFTAAGAVRNNASPDNFIDKDPERFYLRVTDKTRNLDPGVKETITARLGTLTGAGVADDDLTEVRLDETGNTTGIFVSQAQLLMSSDLLAESFTDTDANCRHNAAEPFVDSDGDGSHDTDNPDDDFAAHDGFGGPVCDDAANDRTHRVTVDGRVRAEYQPTLGPTVGKEIFVCDRGPEERKVLNVQITVFNEPWNDVGFDHDGNPATAVMGAGDGVFNFTDSLVNGRHDAGEPSEPFIDISSGGSAFGNAGTRGPIWTDANVDRNIIFLKAALASACIRVVERPRRAVDPTGALFLHTPGFFDDFSDDATGATPSRDEAIIQAPDFRSAVNLNAGQADDVIDIYFVAPFTAAGGAFASQFRPGMVSTNGLDPLLINQVHVGHNTVTDNVIIALPHELIHQLTNTPDSATPSHIFFPTTGAVAHDGTTWTTKRRITAATATLARTSRGASMVVGGNNLLRNP